MMALSESLRNPQNLITRMQTELPWEVDQDAGDEWSPNPTRALAIMFDLVDDSVGNVYTELEEMGRSRPYTLTRKLVKDKRFVIERHGSFGIEIDFGEKRWFPQLQRPNCEKQWFRREDFSHLVRLSPELSFTEAEVTSLADGSAKMMIFVQNFPAPIIPGRILGDSVTFLYYWGSNGLELKAVRPDEKGRYDINQPWDNVNTLEDYHRVELAEAGGLDVPIHVTELDFLRNLCFPHKVKGNLEVDPEVEYGFDDFLGIKLMPMEEI